MRFIVLRRIAAGLVVAAVGPLAVLLWPSPAHAAATCTGVTNVRYASEFEVYMRMPSIGNGTWRLDCELGPNNFSSAVRSLQQALRDCYQQNIKDDSHFGPLTREALRNAQRRINSLHNAGLVVDGIYGPRTRKYFTWLLRDPNNNVTGCGYYGA